MDRRSPRNWLAGFLIVTAASSALPTEAVAQSPVDPLTLERAIRSARALNETPQIAQARLERARAARAEAVANLVPDLTLSST